MIEINLIPDVKNELLKAQSLRNRIILFSIVASIACAGLIVLVASFVFVAQPLTMSAKDRQIKEGFAALEGHPDVTSTVTLQNQLSQIDSLRAAAPNTSRLIGQIIVAIQPTGENSVSYSSINYDPVNKLLSVEGQASGGFPALEAFRKTIAETKIVYREVHQEKGCTADDVRNETNNCISDDLVDGDVTTEEQSLGDGEDGSKVLRFKLSFKINDSALSFTSKDFAVLPPGRKDVTDSRIQIPDDIFKARTDVGEEE